MSLCKTHFLMEIRVLDSVGVQTTYGNKLERYTYTRLLFVKCEVGFQDSEEFFMLCVW